MDRFEMPRVQPKERPQESVQFTGPESRDDVILFVRKYRPRINATFDDVMGTLVFDGDDHGDGGRELKLKLKLNDLVVYQHGDLHVMPARMFLPAADDTDD